jgi:pyruvate formate lyase activating enzyme
MKFGGLQKNSLIDYPGKIACVLFVCGCNFDCPYCHNPELVKKTSENPLVFHENEAYDFLKKRIGLIDAVVISGGEPTLQADLADVCQYIKQMGFQVKVDTNGSRPEVIRQLITNELVDYLAMDIKTDPPAYSPVIKKKCKSENIQHSIRQIMESPLAYEFKTTCIKPLVDEMAIEKISRLISGARLYVLQQFRDTGVLHPEFFKKNPDQYSKKELMRLKTIADPWVNACKVR